MKRNFHYIILLFAAYSCTSEIDRSEEYYLRDLVIANESAFDSLDVEFPNDYRLKKTTIGEEVAFEFYKDSKLIRVFQATDVKLSTDYLSEKYDFKRSLYFNSQAESLESRNYYTIDRNGQSPSSICILNFPFEGINCFE